MSMLTRIRPRLQRLGGLAGLVCPVVIALVAGLAAVPAEAQGNPGMTVFAGPVESLPDSPDLLGEWRVAEVVVHVTAATQIIHPEKVEVGVLVSVIGQRQADQSVLARKIVVMPDPQAPPPGPVEALVLVLHLHATADAPDEAKGVALAGVFAFVDGSRNEDLKVAVSGLLPDHVHDVFIDGFHAGSILTDELGRGLLFLSTRGVPGALPMPDELRPVDELGAVEVRTSEGLVVLFGDFADARRHDDPDPGRTYIALAFLHDEFRQLKGQATAKATEEQQNLFVAGWRLDPNTEYTIFVDEQELGMAETDENGHFRLAYSTQPDGEAQPLPEQFLPVSGLLLVKVKNSEGDVAAAGAFSALGRPSGPRPVIPRPVVPPRPGTGRSR